jgi:hypothetical protein
VRAPVVFTHANGLRLSRAVPIRVLSKHHESEKGVAALMLGDAHAA